MMRNPAQDSRLWTLNSPRLQTRDSSPRLLLLLQFFLPHGKPHIFCIPRTFIIHKRRYSDQPRTWTWSWSWSWSWREVEKQEEEDTHKKDKGCVRSEKNEKQCPWIQNNRQGWVAPCFSLSSCFSRLRHESLHVGCWLLVDPNSQTICNV